MNYWEISFTEREALCERHTSKTSSTDSGPWWLLKEILDMKCQNAQHAGKIHK